MFDFPLSCTLVLPFSPPSSLLTQDDLETVIPRVGGVVCIMNRDLRGEEATVEKINIDDYNVDLKLITGKYK